MKKETEKVKKEKSPVSKLNGSIRMTMGFAVIFTVLVTFIYSKTSNADVVAWGMFSFFIWTFVLHIVVYIENFKLAKVKGDNELDNKKKSARNWSKTLYAAFIPVWATIILITACVNISTLDTKADWFEFSLAIVLATILVIAFVKLPLQKVNFEVVKNAYVVTA